VPSLAKTTRLIHEQDATNRSTINESIGAMHHASPCDRSLSSVATILVSNSALLSNARYRKTQQ